ncbi:MAG: phosphotransferase enzyme family protein [Acidimicrobiia bacterium]
MDLIRADAITLTETDLGRLEALYGIGRLERLGGFENVILRSLDPPRIIRLTHTSRRSLGSIEAEVAFMEHLVKASVPVAAPVNALDGHRVVGFETDGGQPCVVYCMQEAPGAIRYPAEWSDSDIVAYGDLLGRLHAAAQSYPSKQGVGRPAWFEPFFDFGIGLMDDLEVVQLFHDSKRTALDHPVGGADLLIHQDAHFWNLHVDEASRLTLFDFDDCGYGTAEHDIAIVLFYWLLAIWPDPSAEVRRFLQLFLEGYQRHAALADDWPEGMDRILKVREVEIYLLLTMEEIDPNGVEALFMSGRRDRLLAGTPYLGVRLESLV